MPTKPKKKTLTLEDFATAIQQDLARMATKDDLKQLKGETEAGFRNVCHHLGEIRDDVRRLNEIMASKADLASTIRRELDASPFAKESEVRDLRMRVERIEDKLGTKHTRRAA